MAYTIWNNYVILQAVTEPETRIDTLTRELAVLDAQRRGLVAELRRLTGPRINAGSVISRVLGYLRCISRRASGPATTTELLDYILSVRPQLKRKATAIALYRAARRRLIVRQGEGWVLPADVIISRDEDDA